MFLICMLAPAPGRPSAMRNVTPGILPARPLLTVEPPCTLSRSLALIEDTAPVIDSFFFVPYPITITSSISLRTADKEILSVVLFSTFTCLVE